MTELSTPPEGVPTKHRIALIGVPGSGKSMLAHTLQKAIERADVSGCQCWTPIEVIDDYIPQIEADSDLALGFDASYVGNLHVALGRATLERKCKAKTVITCGTLIETATYVSIEGVAQMGLAQDEERDDYMKRLEATMKTLACLYVDTFHYDHAFYLPPLLTPADMSPESVALLDQHIQTAFAAFTLTPVVPLTADGSPIEIAEKRCAQALDAILGRVDASHT